MTGKSTFPNQDNPLHRQAEENAVHMTESPELPASEKIRQVLHELQVHQIELEMQNEELRTAQVELDGLRARYFDLYDLAPVGYCTVSEKGLILETNLTAARLLGVDRGDLVKKPITRFIHQKDQDIYYLLRKHLLETGEPQSCELRMQKKVGELFWARLGATVAQDTDGAPVCRVVMSDITDRKRNEDALRESEEALRAMLSEKEVLLKEVHHRVKNNLQVISSLISLQADNLIDEGLRKGLRDLRDRVQTIVLVHEMLYQMNDLTVLDFAEYVAGLLKYLWRSHGAAAERVRLNMSLAPLMLPVDVAVPCGLIINELACNAIKHAFPSQTECEFFVSLEHESATGGVRLRVRDNGVGLPADLDWRQSNTLGLRLVQMLAGQVHGAIQSGPGPGTEFQVNFTYQEGHHV
jgi:PAS domain S-box-containing protein